MIGRSLPMTAIEFEEPNHFRVLELLEPFVPLADCQQIGRHLQKHQPIGFGAYEVRRLRRSDRG